MGNRVSNSVRTSRPTTVSSMANIPGGMWMAFTLPMVRGAYSDSSVDTRQIHVCDFASAGSTWDESVRYRVWLPKLLHPQEKR